MKIYSLMRGWSTERNIIKGTTAKEQVLKLTSEMGELSGNLLTGGDIRDDIGDMMQVIINIVVQHNRDPLVLIEEAEVRYHNSPTSPIQHKSFLALVQHIGNVNDQILKGQCIRESMVQSVMQLIDISQMIGESLELCCKVAYDDIKDRNGFVVNGTYLKARDLLAKMTNVQLNLDTCNEGASVLIDGVKVPMQVITDCRNEMKGKK